MAEAWDAHRNRPARVLETHSLPVRESVERLRVLIRATVPDAIESAHAVWHSLSYKHPASGYFCGIFPQSDRVDVAFEFGVLLPDPDRVLEGAHADTGRLGTLSVRGPKRTSRVRLHLSGFQ